MVTTRSTVCPVHNNPAHYNLIVEEEKQQI